MAPSAAATAAPQPKLRLFTTFDKGAGSGSGKAAPAGQPTPEQLAALTRPSSQWSPFFALTARHDLPTTSLLLHCVAHGYSRHGGVGLLGFDRGHGSIAGSGGQAAVAGEAAADEAAAEGQFAAALAEHVVPGWWYLTRSNPLLWRWQLATLLESPCLGVPGLCRYTAARHAWLRAQVQLAVDADNCRQVVVLRSGWSDWSHSLAQAGVKFYEVDSRQAVQRKREALDALLGPGWRRQAGRPRFVEVDFGGSLKSLITELTAAGFDPSARCCVLAEGLLPYLSQDQAQSLLADLAALCAPGSRLLFDFLHADALDSLLAGAGAGAWGAAGDSATLPGLASLAAAAANKGCPLQSGLKPSFSAMVRWLQPHNFRLAALLPPHEVARYSQQTQQQHAPNASAPDCKEQHTNADKGLVSLPYVPEFFSLAAAVKQGPRLLLRHADASPAGAGAADASGLAGLEGLRSAALSSPSCIIRSLAFLFCGASLAGAATAVAEAAAGGATALAAPRRPSVAAEGSSEAAPLPPQQEHSTDWKLAAVALSQAGSDCTAAAGSTSDASTGGSAALPDPAGGRGLDHALSIAAILPLSRRSGSSGGGSRSSSGGGFERLMHDAGHLLGGGSSSSQPAAPEAAGAAARETGGEAAGFWERFFSSY